MSTAAASAIVVNRKILNLNQRKLTVLPASSSSFISIKCPPYRYDVPSQEEFSLLPHWLQIQTSLLSCNGMARLHILEDKPALLLKYKAFGCNIEFSWLARNMQPIPNQKIHWRSLEGPPNRGTVRFFPKGAFSCVVEVILLQTISTLRLVTFLCFLHCAFSLVEPTISIIYSKAL